FIVGLISGSLALLADALNSFTDILASIGIGISVRVSAKKADENHPFGHHRAEPIAGFLVAIFMAILGIAIVREAIMGLIRQEKHSYFGIVPVIVLVVTICLKFFMSAYLKKVSKKINSPAIYASSVDCRNDVFISFIAIIGIIGTNFGLIILDDIAALIISIVIFYSAYKIAAENIDYLMGKTPSKVLVDRIRKKALSVMHVQGVNDLRAHYVGNYVQAEIHIEVDRKLSTEKSHMIGKQVQNKVEAMKDVDKAFVHIDPV
ncbi:MAG: cation diffusion facilitator family transporter, partial [Nanoarchaeota archaeon]|nr:cation diffusion facilitator family transporter [Nanoarchaeota archaeon]